MLDMQFDGAIAAMGVGNGERHPGFVVEQQLEVLAGSMGNRLAAAFQLHAKDVGRQVLYRDHLAGQGPRRHAFLKWLGQGSISDAAPYTPGWLAAFGYEFIERADGFKGLSQTYHLEFQKPPTVMELGLTYRALAEKNVDLIAGDATNGLIAALDLFMLKDDQAYFPPYDGVPVFRTEILERYPELRGVLNALAGTIDENQMRRMNYQVDGEKKRVREVVSEFLRTTE